MAKGKLGDLSRPVLIHICKDGTFTYRRPGTPIFNGVALPFFSVESENEAKELRELACRKIAADHPDLPPGEPWYKLNTVFETGQYVGACPVFEYEDFDEIEEYLEDRYALMKGTPARAVA